MQGRPGALFIAGQRRFPMVAMDKLDGALATVAGGNVAMAGWLQGLTTNSPLSKEASWRADVVWAVPT